MKRKLIYLSLAFLLLNCQEPKAKNPPAAPTEIEVKGDLPDPVPTATNSTDYLGIYKGTLPCADCPGIETSLELSEDFTYTKVTKYKGKSDKTFESKGTFRWAADGKTVLLDNGTDAPDQYRVGDATLTRLNRGGKKIGGTLADKYVLKKIADAAVEKLPIPEQDQSQDIVGVRWKLVELNGNAVQHTGEKPYFIELDPMNAFTGFAGCNNLRGHYEINKNRIRFMRIVGTMKGCPQLPAEEKFKTVLSSANNFERNDKVLLFRDGEKVLARFEATAK